ncbi:MAG: restriction endonuclease subunit R [Flavobacteriaceae bacterium]|nr:restriction endonuclease subunit R [Flavobacteriaceae bacterium]|tara:strand:+ start:58099 stop:58548 length:450 start_codon:yes stop_codon:yes gene_type:complete
MQKLNLPTFDYQLKSNENKTLIFDKLRKKYVVLTPEEWVRQHFVHYLLESKKYPISLIAIEKQLTLNGLKKRFDILIFSPSGAPHIIVECKAPEVAISQATFDQIAQYNMTLQAEFLIVTNGIQHYCFQKDSEEKKYNFLSEIPPYNKQ